MSDELKSAWELALEKLDEAEPGRRRVDLTAGQKERIAAVRADAKAKRAELEVLHASRTREARADGDAEALLRLEAERAEELARIDETEEAGVAAIRAEPAG